MQHLLTTEEIVALGRPIGNVEGSKLLAYITEAEQMYIKPALGDALFLEILKEGDSNETYRLLLNGGTYNDCNGGIRLFMGLKVALSYYVYALNVMTGDFQSTRFGTVIKQNDYSRDISSKERSDCYNNALEVANHYLKDCITFCKIKNLIRQYSNRNITPIAGCTIRKIGS